MSSLAHDNGSIDWDDLNWERSYGPDGRNGRQGDPVLVESNAASHDRDDARRLWEVSEDLTGVHWSLPPAPH